MIHLKEEQLHHLSTQRLLMILRSVHGPLDRATFDDSGCDIFDRTRYNELYSYKAIIKGILKNREHIKRKARKPTMKKIKVLLNTRGRGKYRIKYKSLW